MKFRGFRAGILSAILISVFLLPSPGCTVKEEERAPGPLVIWLESDPEAEAYIRATVAIFRDVHKIPIELEFKDRYEINVALLDHMEDVRGKVDVIEVDLFDVENLASRLDTIGDILPSVGTRRFYQESMAGGRVNGRTVGMPFRLSWPVMVAKKEVRGAANWPTVMRKAKENSGQVIIPALDDKELFSILCSLVWSFDGDFNPDNDGLKRTLEWLEDISPHLSPDSAMVKSGDLAEWQNRERPQIFFEWPRGLIPLINDAQFEYNLSVHPMPCGRGRECPVFAFGKYLAVPEGSVHKQEALEFIKYMISPEAQRELVYATPWLPVSSEGWLDLGPRAEQYRAFSERAGNIKAPPTDLPKVQRALSKAGLAIIVDKKTAEQALEIYREEWNK